MDNQNDNNEKEALLIKDESESLLSIDEDEELSDQISLFNENQKKIFKNIFKSLDKYLYKASYTIGSVFIIKFFSKFVLRKELIYNWSL